MGKRIFEVYLAKEGVPNNEAYKALGNSVAIPCVEFIMGRIVAVLRAV